MHFSLDKFKYLKKLVCGECDGIFDLPEKLIELNCNISVMPDQKFKI